MKMKKLGWYNRLSFFKQPFYEGELCRYSLTDFMISDVKYLAHKNNVIISHFSRGTDEYGRFGSNVFGIVVFPNIPKEEFKPVKPVLFDVEMLSI